jgi:hypothetical protein
MFCPKCAAQTVQGQRFCRNCGANIGVIVDAIEGKQRGPIDFETLKSDLRELGSNLRAGFEQFKGTHRLDKPQSGMAPQLPANVPQPGLADLAQELHKSIKRDIEGQVQKGLSKVRVANSRKYSLQQATLSIFSGGAIMFAWQYVLQHSTTLIHSIENIVLQQTGAPIEGLEIIKVLWLLGLIPIARGVAHLANGIFFAPKQEQQIVEEPVFQPQSYAYSPTYPTPVSAVPTASHIGGTTTNELNQKAGISQPSVTEDATLRLEDARPQS